MNTDTQLLVDEERKMINQLEEELARRVAEDKEDWSGYVTGCVIKERGEEVE